MATSLPIIEVNSTPSKQDLIRFFHQAMQHWRRHLGEETPCDVGMAVVDKNEPAFNVLMDAAIEPNGTVESAMRAVEAVFASFGGCRAWIMNPSAPEEQTGPLVERLTAKGFQSVARTILYLPNPSVPANSDSGNLKIIPARAAYTAVSQLGEAAAGELGRKELADAAIRHLDDGHYDALIAFEDNRPVGRVGVLAIGEVGLVEELYVTPDCRGRGVETILLARAVEIAARSRFRHLFTAIASGDAAAGELMMRAGFTPVGPFISYIIRVPFDSSAI
jgi:GNAT superfamily N-acetyltransferase